VSACRPTRHEQRREIIAGAVRHINLKGAHVRGARQEWAESRKRAGWDPVLVEHAIGGGALAKVRARARNEEETDDRTMAKAMHALSIIDAGRAVEIVLPRWPERHEATAGG
jgi:hypothetical protein